MCVCVRARARACVCAFGLMIAHMPINNQEFVAPSESLPNTHQAKRGVNFTAASVHHAHSVRYAGSSLAPRNATLGIMTLSTPVRPGWSRVFIKFAPGPGPKVHEGKGQKSDHGEGRKSNGEGPKRNGGSEAKAGAATATVSAGQHRPGAAASAPAGAAAAAQKDTADTGLDAAACAAGAASTAAKKPGGVVGVLASSLGRAVKKVNACS